MGLRIRGRRKRVPASKVSTRASRVSNLLCQGIVIDDDEHEPTCEDPGAVPDKALFNLMRCPYCRTNVTWGAMTCPTCRAQISYGCTVPATGCLLAVVVAFLAGSALVGLCSPGESAGGGKLSQNLLLGIGALSALLGLGLWLLMCHVAKRFVSFAPKRRD
jgi:hypothetical protein